MIWHEFQRPSQVQPEEEDRSETFARFIAQPFERGWGTTVGNALRRALLVVDSRCGHHRRQDRRRRPRVFGGSRCRRGRHRHHPQSEEDSAQDPRPGRGLADPRRQGAGRGHGRSAGGFAPGRGHRLRMSTSRPCRSTARSRWTCASPPVAAMSRPRRTRPKISMSGSSPSTRRTRR